MTKTAKKRKWRGWPGTTPEEFEELVEIERSLLAGEEKTIPLDDLMRKPILRAAKKLK
jgi:hypothetical protein